jgi:hypothetical protein
MVRIIEGQGFCLASTHRPMPRNGLVAAWFQGLSVIRMDPVSVCHQVSIIGLSSPVARWNHSQASGLIGSPAQDAEVRDHTWACLP